MKISTILDHIDSGHMALPEFQRGYVWNRDQVRWLFDSLYRRHPVVVLLNEEATTIALASQAGYRCFTKTGAFRHYVQQEVLGGSLNG